MQKQGTPMPDPATEAPDARPLPQGDPLAALGRAGVATHAVRFDAERAAVARLADEARVLEALADIVEGQIFRLAPLAYAVRLGGDSAADAALKAALTERLGVDAATVERIAAEPAPHEDAAALLSAFAAGPAPRTRVIDAPAAVAAAERAADRIGALAAEAQGRMQAATADIAERLERVEVTVAAAPPPADGDLGERLERIEAALEHLRPRPDATAAADGAGVAEAVARLDACAERLTAAAEAAEDMPRRLATIETALERLAAAVPPESGDAALESRLDALAETLDALAAKSSPTMALSAEREGFGRALFSLQTLVARMEGEFARIDEAGDAFAPLADRFAGLAESLAAALEAAEAGAATLTAARHAAEGAAEAAGKLVALSSAAQADCDALRAQQAATEASRPSPIAIDQTTAERIGATLAEFLAQIQRLESLRPARPERKA